MKTRRRWLACGAAALAAAAAAFVGLGVYDVSATAQHTQPVYDLLELVMRRSVQMRARSIDAPAAFGSEAALQRGAACYRDHCVRCHGGPGIARGGEGMGMQPVPSALIDAARDWRPREIYWITRHGIKMSGMPAWQYRLGDEELWAVTAFVMRLAELTPAEVATRLAQAQGRSCPAGGDGDSALPAAERGRLALRQYACHACHEIPGIVGAQPQVGPPLGGIAGRSLIAGRLANTPDNMAAWLREPQRFDAATAMPALGVSEQHARDIAAYLATLR